MSEKRWLTPKDIEIEYEISESCQAKKRMQKIIPYTKVGKFIRYDRVLINKWLENHNVTEGK
mgnify:CR=1 FL=1